MKTTTEAPAKAPGIQNEYLDVPVRLKAYSQQELCDLYNITRKTFHTWIEPFGELIGKRAGKYFTILQVQIIFQKIGCPGQYF